MEDRKLGIEAGTGYQTLKELKSLVRITEFKFRHIIKRNKLINGKKKKNFIYE